MSTTDTSFIMDTLDWKHGDFLCIHIPMKKKKTRWCLNTVHSLPRYHPIFWHNSKYHIIRHIFSITWNLLKCIWRIHQIFILGQMTHWYPNSWVSHGGISLSTMKISSCLGGVRIRRFSLHPMMLPVEQGSSAGFFSKIGPYLLPTCVPCSDQSSQEISSCNCKMVRCLAYYNKTASKSLVIVVGWCLDGVSMYTC